MGGAMGSPTERTMHLALLCTVLALLTGRPAAVVEEEEYGVQPNRTVQEKVRIEMVKYQILKNLGLREPPPSQPSKSAGEVVRLLLEERQAEGKRPYKTDATERMIVHSKNGSSVCLNSTHAPCSRYIYELSSNLNMSQAVLWIYRKDSIISDPITVSLSFLSDKSKMMSKEFNTDLPRGGWNKVQLTFIFVPKSWDDIFYMSVELSGKLAEHMGSHDPYLMVQKLHIMPSRQKREATCNPTENCCLKSLKVSFSEIGFSWVLYPTEFEANICLGKCRRDHSEMRNHYERALSQVIENDADIRDSLGDCWTNCCKSKELEAVRVIYNDTTTGVIHDQSIPALRVKSCACS